MTAHLRRNAIAYLALFVALSSTSVAAVSLKRGSVGTKQLKAGAVTSGKVRDASLLARDFRAGQLPAGAPGTAGRDGTDGSAGAAGPTGPTGPASVAVAAQGSSFALSGPPFTPEGQTLGSVTITTPRAGTLFVYGHSRTSIGCTGAVKIGLYVDGAGVPGSGRPATDSAVVESNGLTASLPAGEHVVTQRFDCTGAAATSISVTAGTVGAILVG